MPPNLTRTRKLTLGRESIVKHFGIEANGYNFDVAVDENSPMGEIIMNFPLEMVLETFRKAVIDLNANPDNIDELNEGATQVIYSLV